MAATTYNIHIINNSGLERNYLIFAKPPVVSGTLGEVYSNAWVTLPDIPTLCNAYISYTDEIFAYWGTVESKVAPGADVYIGQGVPVQLGPDGTDYFFTAQPTGFDFSKTANDAPAGQFSITSASNFGKTSQFVFGLAKINGSGLVAPVATFAGQPNTTFNIAPVTNFWVSTGSYTAGTVIDITAIGQSIEVDFTGKSETTAIVTQDSSRQFTVRYFISMSQAALHFAYTDQSIHSVARYISPQLISDLSVSAGLTKTYTLTWKDPTIATTNLQLFENGIKDEYPSVTILDVSGTGSSKTIKVKGNPPVDTIKYLTEAIVACSHSAVIT